MGWLPDLSVRYSGTLTGMELFLNLWTQELLRCVTEAVAKNHGLQFSSVFQSFPVCSVFLPVLLRHLEASITSVPSRVEDPPGARPIALMILMTLMCQGQRSIVVLGTSRPQETPRAGGS